MSAEENFRLYLRLSEELLKFISQAEPDIDEFLDLVAQRGRLVDRMKHDPETELFRQTEVCLYIIGGNAYQVNKSHGKEAKHHRD